MNRRRHLTLVAAAATLLAALPLSTVFVTWTWLFDVIVVLTPVVAVGVGVRSMRVPAWVPSVAMFATFVLMLSWVFRSGHELLGMIPTGATFAHWNSLLGSARTNVQQMGVPVDDTDGLLFLTAVGVGAVALVVDLVAVLLRRPALAGLPMLAIYSVPVAVHRDSVSVIPFIAGAAGFLWLLATDNVDRVRRFGRRFTGDGRSVDLWEPSPLAATGRRLATAGVAIAVLLPLLVPGMTTGILDRFGTVGDGFGIGGGGGGATVDLSAMLAGQLNRSVTTTMAEVTTNDTDPPYLRFGVAADLAEDGFRSRPPIGGPSAGRQINAPTFAAGTAEVHTGHATVKTLNFDMNLAPVYVQPTKVNKLGNDWRYDASTGLVYSSRSRINKKTYDFDYARVSYTADGLRRAAPLATNDPLQQRYTATPNSGAAREVAKRANDLTANITNPYDKVLALYSYFSSKNGFTYSTATKTGDSGSDILDFLDNKQGFCVQYSAALAWLVRSIGVPARVAFGFTRGSKKQGVSTYTLTTQNLHAWTEVYFQNFGWVPFDATPSLPNTIKPSWAPDPNQVSTGGGRDDIPNAAAGGVNPSASSSTGPISADERNIQTGAGTAPTTPLPQWPFWTALGVIVSVALLLAPALTRRGLRRRRRPAATAGPITATATATGTATGTGTGTGPQVVVADDDVDAARRRAHHAWDELLDTMVDYRFQVDPADTPRVTVDRLVHSAALTGGASDGARALGSAEEQARYARRPATGEGLGTALDDVREAIRGRVSRRTRIMATLLPPSLLYRWRTTVAIRGAAAVNRIGRARDRVLATVNLRRLLARGAR